MNSHGSYPFTVWHTELGVLDAVKSHPYLEKFEKTVKRIYLYYHYSPKRRRELSEIGKVLDEDLLQYGAVKSVRWVTSKSRALCAIERNLHATIIHTEHSNSSNRNAEESGKAKAIHTIITNVRFVKFLYMMLDLLSIITSTSKLFQCEDLLIVEVPDLIEELKMKIKALKTNPGSNMIEFQDNLKPDGSFGSSGTKLKGGNTGTGFSYKDYTDTHKILDRFSNFEEEPLKHFSVFNFTIWSHDYNELIEYGNASIVSLIEHFRCILPFTQDELDCISQEWISLKNHISKMRSCQMIDVYTVLAKVAPLRLKNICILVKLMLTMSPSTAQCERAFSGMNRIKTPQRNALSKSSLQDTVRIYVDGPKLADFDPTESINIWLTDGPGTRHLDGHALPCQPEHSEAHCSKKID